VFRKSPQSHDCLTGGGKSQRFGRVERAGEAETGEIAPGRRVDDRGLSRLNAVVAEVECGSKGINGEAVRILAGIDAGIGDEPSMYTWIR
jgi:hypothetical protein